MFSDHSGAQCTGGGEDVLVDVYTSDGRTVPAEVRPLGSSPVSSHAFLSRYNSQNVSISFEACMTVMIHAHSNYLSLMPPS